ncbi:MAG: carbamoyltransferase [Candidatus Omnitrophota bacterium]
MRILGVNYIFHDSAAALVCDGKLIAMVEEERLNRQKHTAVFPAQSIDYCLKEAGLTFTDLDVIVYSAIPRLHFSKKILHWLKYFPNGNRFLLREIYDLAEKEKGRLLWQQKMEHFYGKLPEIHFAEHHLCHAASSFFVSPFESAAILSIDGSGEWATTMLAHGQDRTIRVLDETYYPHSLGTLYETVTQFVGFKPNYDEGKVMGLAPYGEPDAYRDAFRRVVHNGQAPQIRLDLDYFQYHLGQSITYSQKFMDVFGAPRKPGEPLSKNHENVARGVQEILEDSVRKIAIHLRDRTGEKNLVLAGGIALNSVTNGKLIKEGLFEKAFVNPAAHDAGTAIGAAYWHYHQVLGKERCFVLTHPSWGPGFSNGDILKILKYSKLKYSFHPSDIIEKAVDALNQRKIVGWFQGRTEIGPRALGNRSILANPTFPEMKEILNREVKHREPFRPFAPSVAEEDQGRIFDCSHPAPYMLFVYDVLPEWRSKIPAVTHVDGSGRLQTVTKDYNEKYYNLIKAFEKRTGVPVVLNTSFNIMGEPIVNTPAEALRCFFSTGIDVLALGDYWLEKTP